MSRQLIPRPNLGDSEMSSATPAAQKPRKISTACFSCKQRKTRCSGNAPCDACAARGSACVYDATSDQRRKIANQKNIQELVEAQTQLDRHKQLLGGIIATFRAGGHEASEDLLDAIRSGDELSQLAAHVRNARRANPEIEEAFARIQFVIDGDEELPPPDHLLNIAPSYPMASRDSMSGASVDGYYPSGSTTGSTSHMDGNSSHMDGGP